MKGGRSIELLACSNMKKYFFEIDGSLISERVILLDIDGTIAFDESEDVSEKSIGMIRALEKNNKVFLLSNNKNRERIAAIEGVTGLKHLSTQKRKPSRKILKAPELVENKKILIIGDKYLTDVLFAKRVGVECLKVRRLSAKKDRLFVKCSFWLDDLASFIFGRIV